MYEVYVINFKIEFSSWKSIGIVKERGNGATASRTRITILIALNKPNPILFDLEDKNGNSLGHVSSLKDDRCWMT